LNISIKIFVLLVFVSIPLTLFENDNAWYDLIINYTIGIACSILVVIITTCVQYKIEQTKLLNVVLNKTSVLFTKLNTLYGTISLTEITTANELSKLSELCFEIARACADLEFYSREEKKKISRIFVYSMEIKTKIDEKQLAYTSVLLKILESDELIQLGDSAVSLNYKDGCQAYIKEELEVVKTRNLK
jgi:hypothetical protein